MAIRNRQQDDGGSDVADATETTESRPAEGCDGDRAYHEMISKPGGSDEGRPFTRVECGHRWRET